MYCFLSLLSSQRICQFYFHCFISQLALCFSFSSLCFNQFCSDRYNSGFPLFTGSIYCALFLLDYFDFDDGYICICVYSVTLSLLSTSVSTLGFAVLWTFPFFPLFAFLFHFFLFPLFPNFNFLNLLYVSTCIPSFAFPTVLFPLKLIFNVYKSSLSASI